ncbi:MAG: hypothetical protein AAGA66_16350, partial [Bacteroidota bacterium]
MRVNWLTIAIVLTLLVGCTEDDFPEGIYGYQVERLLSGGGQKVWIRVTNSSNCQDSVRLVISATTNDSVTVR